MMLRTSSVRWDTDGAYVTAALETADGRRMERAFFVSVVEVLQSTESLTPCDKSHLFEAAARACHPQWNDERVTVFLSSQDRFKEKSPIDLIALFTLAQKVM